eukprot:c25937_g2_i1 orf=978-2201(-)
MDSRFSTPPPLQQWQNASRMDSHSLWDRQQQHQQQQVVFPNAYAPDQPAIGRSSGVVPYSYLGVSPSQGYYTVETLDGQTSLPSMGITSQSHILPTEGGRVVGGAPMQQGYDRASTEHAFLNYQSVPHAAFGMPPPPLYDANQAWTSDGRADMILPHSRTPAFQLGQEPVPTPYGWSLGRDQQPGRGSFQSYHQDQSPVAGTKTLDRDSFRRIQSSKLWKHQRSKGLQQQKSQDKIADDRKSAVRTLQTETAPGWCSLCQIECNTAEILKVHLAGKRHKKQLEKQTLHLVSQIQAGRNVDPQSIEGYKQVELGPDLNAVVADVMSIAEYNKKRKRAMDQEVISSNDSKHAAMPRDKVEMESGLPEKCELCNVSCGTRSILESHLAGRKHAARVMMLKQDSMSKGDGQ